MRSMRYAVILVACILAGAAPAGDDPDVLLRRANAAFAAGDVDTAESLYTDAEERTGDPGLIAFNKAAVLFARHDYYGAEVHYARTLDDARDGFVIGREQGGGCEDGEKLGHVVLPNRC